MHLLLFSHFTDSSFLHFSRLPAPPDTAEPPWGHGQSSPSAQSCSLRLLGLLHPCCPEPLGMLEDAGRCFRADFKSSPTPGGATTCYLCCHLPPCCSFWMCADLILLEDYSHSLHAQVLSLLTLWPHWNADYFSSLFFHHCRGSLPTSQCSLLPAESLWIHFGLQEVGWVVNFWILLWFAFVSWYMPLPKSHSSNCVYETKAEVINNLPLPCSDPKWSCSVLGIALSCII